MTQNQASLRWKKPGFEQKFLMQGEKQVPAASGCRKFYGDSNFHLFPLIFSISSSGFAVSSHQAGWKPLLIALRAETMFDQAQQ